MADWIRKVGTTGHPLEAILQDKNGPANLTSGTTVIFRGKIPSSATAKFNANGVVVSPDAMVGDADRGKVRYILTLTDIDSPGIYEVDIIATVPGVGTQVFPEDGFMILLVLQGADLV